jgi:acyl-CoA synthetase (AMP-forming)/AMP-acid ligase II
MPHVRYEPAGDADTGADAGWQALAFIHEYGFQGYAGEDGIPQAHGGAFATRDIGRIDDRGFLHVLGRSDHHVKRDGRLVSLTDVESALRHIDGIRQAAVIASDHGRRGRTLVAVCVPAGPDEPDERRLRRACLDVLPRHAIPDRFVLVADLPRLPSGKLDRVRLGVMHGQAGVPAGTAGLSPAAGT